MGHAARSFFWIRPLPPCIMAPRRVSRPAMPGPSTASASGRTGVPAAPPLTLDPRWSRRTFSRTPDAEQYRALALPHGLRSCWSTPIRGRTGTTGTFAVYHMQPHRPTNREQRLVARVTHLASIAIDHSRLFGALAESEERFRHAFEDSAAGMALTDLRGGFVKVNAALAGMLLRPENDLLTTTIGAVLTPTPTAPVIDTAALLADVAAARRESAQFDAEARRSDGKIVQVTVVASAVRNADGQPVHLSLNIQDVTQRYVAERERRARREAEVAYEVAETASRAKSGFLTALSHELRTPLQAISGFAELLGTLDLPAERRQAALAHIQGATTHIIALVDDVLDIAKIEAGALPVHIAAIEPGPVISEVLDLLLPLADQRRITLLQEPAGNGARSAGRTHDPGPVLADGRRLRQVLINLVTNAIRYNNPRGKVWVWAGIPRGSAAVTINVADSGPGIAADKLDRLFISFDRLGIDGDEEQGAGLGLPLARGLTEAMGGQLLVDSQPGVGTTVAVVLPASR